MAKKINPLTPRRKTGQNPQTTGTSHPGATGFEKGTDPSNAIKNGVSEGPYVTVSPASITSTDPVDFKFEAYVPGGLQELTWITATYNDIDIVAPLAPFAKIIDDFQSESGPPVLIMSLKAGGIGLNLTAADHVFIMDPWWNPAVETQASDRAHRIGQEKPVMIYKVVALNSIEEKIIELQHQKQSLFNAVIDNELLSNFQLDKQDLINLLR